MNIGQMMRQVQDMQAKMAEMQNRLGGVEVTGSAGNGLVVITTTGKGEVRKVKIEMLEDLIVAACNDAKQKAEAMIQGETEKMMGGLKLPPGVKLPF
jgi:nucleoid-associated protein EbfC